MFEMVKYRQHYSNWIIVGLFTVCVIFSHIVPLFIDSAFKTDHDAINDKVMPLCLDGVLNRENQFVPTNAMDNSMMILPKDPCLLHDYTVNDVLYCLIDHKPSMHIAFMGDSRIRQQFLSFLRLIPDYDRRRNDELEEQLFHNDANVTSLILGGLIISYRWRPLINDKLLSEFRDWVTKPITAPDFTLIGVGVWDIRDGNKQKIYVDRLKEILPIFRQLTRDTRKHRKQVVWMNQYPLIDQRIYGPATDLNSDKIHRYNLAMRNMFRDTGVQVWDSSGPIEEEYLRACVFNQRHDGLTGPTLFRYNGANFNCEDSVHAGKVVVAQKTQILYNHLCNYRLHSQISK